MTTVGVLARFDFKAGHDEDAARFFSEGRAIVEGQPKTTGWFAFRLGPTTYCAFASFTDAADRAALLAAGGPVLSRKFGHLFATPPTFDLVDIVEARIPLADA
jgi:hypothetical protein